MKKFISAVALAALSTSAYANVLMPEISRDGKTKNTSVLAVSQDKRSYIAGQYTSQALETDTTPSIDLDITVTNLFGAVSTDTFSFEGSYAKNKMEAMGSEQDLAELNLLMGFRTGGNLTLGLGLSVDELSDTIDDTIIEAGGTIVVNGTTLGASLAHHMVDAVLTEGDYTVLTLAFGKQDKSVSWETGIQYTTKGNDAVLTDTRLGVFANGTMIVNNVELDGSLTYEYGDYLQNRATDNDYSQLEISLDAEFLVGPTFYITPGIYHLSTTLPKAADSDTSILGVKSDFGYRANGLDTTFGLSYSTGELEGIDADGLGFNLNVGYKF
ncbi:MULTISPECIES: hypothetical protein [unclassified Halobacteriovorax]|uniref:hypothetical protein n=1 Tax=unclassified Halobacteriovorax TaxID=2639665 RepID=UPI00399AE8F1